MLAEINGKLGGNNVFRTDRLNGENYQTEIFGTIEKLHAWEG